MRLTPTWRMPDCCSGTPRRRPQLLRARRQRLRQTQAVSSRWSTFPNGLATGPSRPFHPRHATCPTPRPQANQNESAAALPRDDSRLDRSALVEETWSRWAEWGMNLIVLGVWLTVLVLLVYFVFGQEFYGLAFLLLIVGLLAAVVLAYPMLITLERPVRVTPEQALKDFYGALSHHVPHVRRMWLLLSSAGRISAAYGSFEGFKAYWKEQLARLRQGHAGPLTPLVFEVIDFKSEKGAGRSRIDVTYTVVVSVRGSARPVPCTRSRRQSPWFAGPTTCGISKMERCLCADGTAKSGRNAGKRATEE